MRSLVAALSALALSTLACSSAPNEGGRGEELSTVATPPPAVADAGRPTPTDAGSFGPALDAGHAGDAAAASDAADASDDADDAVDAGDAGESDDASDADAADEEDAGF